MGDRIVSDIDYTFVETVSGLAFDFTCPAAETIEIGDIAYALSRTNRWGGHSQPTITVAQHCVLVSQMLRNTACSVEIQMQGLLHDAAEAYLGDVPSPIKAQLPDYKALEELVERAIFDKYGVDYPVDRMVKRFDTEAMRWEYRDFMSGGRCRLPFGNRPRLQAWGSDKAEQDFLAQFFSLQFARTGKENAA